MTRDLLGRRLAAARRAPRALARRALPCALVAFVMLAGCEREKRNLRPFPYQAATAVRPVRVDQLQPGPMLPRQVSSPSYDNSSYAIADGQALFAQYNCVGCHANGGGGMGPALIDDQWIYGSDPANIHLTIVEGRPNGMPSFGGHIPDTQVWHLVAYVRALAGLEPKTRIPPRTDHMYPWNESDVAEQVRPDRGPVPSDSTHRKTPD